ncbi:MAG: hypothetical protein HZB14_10810 [Actinobacteria bacterium]|nr:hypothetical protein [Actinomycetota bacterium]
MSASTSSANINDKILEAAENARSNPYVQKLIEDEQLRDSAVSALKSARKAFDRASSKGWDKELAKDKKLRREVEDALAGLNIARAGLAEATAKPKKAKKKSHKLRKILFVAVIGTIVAIAVNEDARKQVLDALFGAEEEFQYTSTTSTNGTS